MITSTYPTICTDSVAETARFYVDLLGFRVVFDSKWFIQLQAPANREIQIGIVEREHSTVPVGHRNQATGFLVTVEVDDVDSIHDAATAQGLEMPLELKDEDFGQRHFMVIDPNGVLVDVITPIAPSGDYMAAYDPEILESADAS